LDLWEGFLRASATPGMARGPIVAEEALAASVDAPTDLLMDLQTT